VKSTLKTTGILRGKELLSCPGMPTRKRMNQGPVAIIECVQEIPCDPCVDACRQGAIMIGEDITQLPQLMEDNCTGLWDLYSWMSGPGDLCGGPELLETESAADDSL
jgi:Na+-translocating ferredoxin:NAD+ oxidoreductase RNF subunit RnfB